MHANFNVLIVPLWQNQFNFHFFFLPRFFSSYVSNSEGMGQTFEDLPCCWLFIYEVFLTQNINI